MLTHDETDLTVALLAKRVRELAVILSRTPIHPPSRPRLLAERDAVLVVIARLELAAGLISQQDFDRQVPGA